MSTRDRIFEAICKKFHMLCPAGLSEHAACLVWALAVQNILQHGGERAVLQAGTCLWPRLRRDQDDGVSSTHFGYEWHSDSPETELAIVEHRMPEIHIWTALPDHNEIIDFTAGFFPSQCKELIGLDWPGDLPPVRLWTRSDALPDGVVYHAYLDACLFSMLLAVNYVREHNLTEVLHAF